MHHLSIAFAKSVFQIDFPLTFATSSRYRSFCKPPWITVISWSNEIKCRMREAKFNFKFIDETQRWWESNYLALLSYLSRFSFVSNFELKYILKIDVSHLIYHYPVSIKLIVPYVRCRTLKIDKSFLFFRS